MGWVAFAFLSGWLIGIGTLGYCYKDEMKIGKTALCKDHLEIKIEKGQRLELFINEQDTLYVRLFKEDQPK